MKRETKIYSQEPQTSSEGSLWEICMFAIIFVVVFTVLARTASAAAAPAPLRKSKLMYAANDPNLAMRSQTIAATADDDNTVAPIHMQVSPSTIPTGALPAANMGASLPDKDSNKRVVWSSSLVLDTAATLSDDDPHSYSGEYLMKTGFTDKKSGLGMLLKFGYDREYSFEQKDGTDGDLVDPSLAITKTWTEGQDFRSPVFDTLVAGIGTVAGASHESARRTFVAAVGPKIGATKVIHKLSFGQMFGYSRKFFNYDIRDDGTVNSPDVFSSLTDISYKLTENLALSFETLLTYGINFQKSGVTNEESSFSIDWDISKTIGTSLGIATKRGTQADDGTYDQVKFYDGTVAQAFFDLTLNF